MGGEVSSWICVAAALAACAAALYLFVELESERVVSAALEELLMDERAKPGGMLGKPCWVLTDGEWVKHRVVAVSWKGAVCVRKWERKRHAYWINKKYADNLVRLDDPEGA